MVTPTFQSACALTMSCEDALFMKMDAWVDGSIAMATTILSSFDEIWEELDHILLVLTYPNSY